MRIIDGKPEYRNAIVSILCLRWHTYYNFTSDAYMILGRLDESNQQGRSIRTLERFHTVLLAYWSAYCAHVHLLGEAHFSLFNVHSARGKEVIAFVTYDQTIIKINLRYLKKFVSALILWCLSSRITYRITMP